MRAPAGENVEEFALSLLDPGNVKQYSHVVQPWLCSEFKASVGYMRPYCYKTSQQPTTHWNGMTATVCARYWVSYMGNLIFQAQPRRSIKPKPLTHLSPVNWADTDTSKPMVI